MYFLPQERGDSPSPAEEKASLAFRREIMTSGGRPSMSSSDSAHGFPRQKASQGWGQQQRTELWEGKL